MGNNLTPVKLQVLYTVAFDHLDEKFVDILEYVDFQVVELLQLERQINEFTER